MSITAILFAAHTTEHGAATYPWQFLTADLHNASISTIAACVLCKHAACSSRQEDKEMQKSTRTRHTRD